MAEMPRTFTALAEVRLASPEPVMLRLCAHFREFGEVTVDGPCCRIDTGFGVAGLEACKGCLKISAEGKDAVALWYTYERDGDQAALERLLAYNREDVENLVKLREALEARVGR